MKPNKPAKRTAKSKKKQHQPSLSDTSDNDYTQCDEESQLSSIIDNFSQQMKEQKKLMKNLTESYKFMSSNFDKLQIELKKIQEENKMMKKDIQKLQSSKLNLKNRMSSLEQFIIKSKQDNNRNNMIITNMPKLSRAFFIAW